MGEVHVGDARARHRVDELAGTGKLAVLYVRGEKQNVLCTVDEVTSVLTHGAERVLVKITEARTKKRHRLYASSVLAARAVEPEVSDEPDDDE